MNERILAANPIVAEARQERIKTLLDGDFEFIDRSKKPRQYQTEIMEKTIDDILVGEMVGRWDIAVGGGKTYMAHSLANHVAKRGGRILYLAAGNPEIENAISGHENSGLGKNNYLRFSDKSDFEMLGKQHLVRQLSGIPFFYSTVQLMTYDKRFQSIPPDFFDLILYDESQDFLGSVMRGPSQHFLSSQIHMSATPFTMREHVGDRVPHVYGGITSPELIKNYGYPKWMIHNYHIEDIPLDGDVIGAGEFDFEGNSALHSHLNLSRRFQIIEQVLEQAVVKNQKSICTVPSVRDAELFVKHFVASNPALYGRIDYVAGIRGTATNKRIKEKLESGELLGVVAKDLWDQSVDIPSVEHIILGDPSRSLRKTTQRIGRGVRPAAGKKALHIHDLVSTVFHSRQAGAPAIRADELIRSQVRNGSNGENGRKVYQSFDVSPVFIEAIENRKNQDYFTRVSNMEMSEQLESADFLSDPDVAIDVFRTYAHEVFGVSPIELLVNIDRYSRSAGVLMYAKNGNSVSLRLQDYLDICTFYNTFDSVKNHDHIKDLVDATFSKTVDTTRVEGMASMKERESQVPVDRRLAPSVTEGFGDFSYRVNYIGALNTATQMHDIISGPPVYRTYISERAENRDAGPKFETEAVLQLKEGEHIIVTCSQLYSDKRDSKQECAYRVIEKLTERSELSVYFAQLTFHRRVSQKDEQKVSEKIKIVMPKETKSKTNNTEAQASVPEDERLTFEILKKTLPGQHPADYLNWLKSTNLCTKVKRNTKGAGGRTGSISLSLKVGNLTLTSERYQYVDGPRDKEQYYQMCFELLTQMLKIPKIHKFLSIKLIQKEKEREKKFLKSQEYKEKNKEIFPV